jgi:hypothetical protein
VKTSDDAANTITLTGTGSDTSGASAWFIPETSVTQITLTSQITSFGRFYLWFAAIRPEATITPLVTTYQAETDPLEAPFAAVSFPAGIDATAFSEEEQTITYQVSNQGDTGCELSDTEPVTLTASTAGACEITSTVSDADGFIGTTTTFVMTITKPDPVVEWVPEVTEFEVTEFPFTVTPPAPPPSPSGEAYTFTKDDTSTSDCTVDEDTSTLVVPQPGTCVVGASTPETDVFAAYTVTTTFTFTGATLAATGANTVPLWALAMAAMGVGVLAFSRRFSRRDLNTHRVGS